MAPQFTESARDALEKAFQLAQENNHTEVNENHLALAFFEDSQGYFWTLSAALGLNPSLLVPQLEAALKKVPTFSGATQAPAISPQLQNRIAEAQAIAKKWNDAYISSDHFFYVFWQSAEGPFASWKKSANLILKEVEARIKQMRGSIKMDSPTAEASLQALDKYCKKPHSLGQSGQTRPRHRQR